MSKACIKLEVRGVCVGLRRHIRRADRGTACPLSLRVSQASGPRSGVTDVEREVVKNALSTQLYAQGGRGVRTGTPTLVERMQVLGTT